MFFCRKKQTANKDKIVFLSKQFILCLFQFENCVFRSESVAKSDKLSYNEKRKRGIFLLLFWRRSSKVRIGVYFMKEKEKTKVVLADRDGFYLQRLKRCLERRGDMTVVGMADNGVALLDLVIQKKPAVLLTDILLGERDGLWVLENIKKRGLPCICIFISAIDSDKLVRQAISLGAEYYMAKPIQGELLLERIHQMLKQETPTKEAAKPKAAERRENPFEELESEITILLSRMGISASIKGYHFIRKAVMMAVENQDVLVGITKGLYPDIAKQYKTTASKVERAIRHAIESVWKKNGPQIYFEIAGYLPTEKPTNGQFIAALSEYFRIKEKGKSKKIS